MRIHAKSFFERPLERINAKDAKPLEKIVAGIAIGIFTLLSLGGYLIFAQHYFKGKKVEHLEYELHQAVIENKIDQVKVLLKKAPDVKKLRLDWPLFRAVGNNNLEMVKFLIEKKAHVDAHMGGETPLLLATEQEIPNFEMINYLVQKKANLNPRMEHSPLGNIARNLNNPAINQQETIKTLELMLAREAHLNEDDMKDLSKEAHEFFRKYEAAHHINIL